MKEQVLSIEQMQELQKLGIDTSNASLYWYATDESEFVCFGTDVDKDCGDEICPAFTLKDMLEMLPKTITDYEGGEPYEYILSIRGTYDGKWWFEYFYGDESIQTSLNCELYIDENLLLCAFELLKWCKQNNYI